MAYCWSDNRKTTFFSAQLFSPQSLLNERKTRPMWTLQRTMETWDSGEWWAIYLAVACIYWRLHSIKLSAHLSLHFLSLTLKSYRSETLLGTMNNPPNTRAPNPITVSYCCVDVRWRGDKSLFVQWLNMCCFEFQTHVRRHKSEQTFLLFSGRNPWSIIRVQVTLSEQSRLILSLASTLLRRAWCRTLCLATQTSLWVKNVCVSHKPGCDRFK